VSNGAQVSRAETLAVKCGSRWTSPATVTAGLRS
jgi:hypothetical protein